MPPPVILAAIGADPIVLVGTGTDPVELTVGELPMADFVRYIIGPSPSPTVYIKRTATPNEHYDLYQEAGDQDGFTYWWCLSMWRPAAGVLPGDPPNVSLRIGPNTFERPILNDDNLSAQWVYTGTWVSVAGSTYGGSWKTCTVAGGFVTFTSPIAVALLQMLTGVVPTGGIARVSIDGDPTLATGLPTIQELVDAGTVANTCLVANGGTLTPTDRVYDHYSATANLNKRITLAEWPTEAVHTVKWEYTPYANVAATGTKRVGVSGMSYATFDLTPGTPDVEMLMVEYLTVVSMTGNGVGSANEISLAFKEPGGSEGPVVGAAHGYENEIAFDLLVDGVSTSMADGEVLEATQVIFDKTCELFSPEIDGGATACAEDRTIYIWDQQGMSIGYPPPAEPGRQTTWKLDLEAVAAWPGMLAMNGDEGNEAVDWYSNSGISEDITLLDNNGTDKGRAIAEIAWAYKGDGHVARSLDFYSLANLAVACNNHVRASPDYEWVEDRTTGSDKMYTLRANTQTAPLEAMADGTFWTAAYRYRARWLASTALLARGAA